MRSLLLLAATAVVLISNGWGTWLASRNRTEPRGGVLQLSERELVPEPTAMESSVLLLRLKWRPAGVTDPNREERPLPPPWLDTNKLMELGFDCSVPPGGDRARRHYSSTPSRPVFLALEHRSTTAGDALEQTRDASALFVVDAAPEPNRLRQRYPDPEKVVICRGLIRMSLRSRGPAEANDANARRLEGWIQQLVPSDVFVPVPQNRGLAKIVKAAPAPTPTTSPANRFVARVRWGRNYEPWIEEVQSVAGGSGDNQTGGPASSIPR